MREPDAAFADPRLAPLCDIVDHDRSDLDAYVAIAAEVEANTVLDVGCGTGSLALRLAGLGMSVIGLDPAVASLDVARAKPNAGRVAWVEGDAAALEAMRLQADLAVMTGNVAQVFVADDDWHRTLEAVRRCLRPHGWFVFETRRPEARAWAEWTLPPTTIALPDGGSAVYSRTVTEVALPLVSFEAVTEVGGAVLRSASTLRFRERAEIECDLAGHGFEVVDVREAGDRPGKEFVFLSRRSTT